MGSEHWADPLRQHIVCLPLASSFVPTPAHTHSPFVTEGDLDRYCRPIQPPRRPSVTIEHCFVRSRVARFVVFSYWLRKLIHANFVPFIQIYAYYMSVQSMYAYIKWKVQLRAEVAGMNALSCRSSMAPQSIKMCLWLDCYSSSSLWKTADTFILWRYCCPRVTPQQAAFIVCWSQAIRSAQHGAEVRFSFLV